MRSLFLGIFCFLFLISACTFSDPGGEVSLCDGVNVSEMIFTNASGGKFLNVPFALEYPDCANEVLKQHGVKNLQVVNGEEFSERVFTVSD